MGSREERREERREDRLERIGAKTEKRQATAALLKWLVIGGVLLWLAFASRGVFGAEQVLGRQNAVAGRILVLRANVQGTYKWVYDETKCQDAVIDATTGTLAFVPFDVGRLVVWLATHDGANLQVHEHVVQVVPAGVAPPPDNKPPPQVGVLDGLPAKYATLAGNLNDQPTAEALVREWRAALGAVRGSPNITEAGAPLRDAFELAMETRQGDSKQADWLNGFRIPLNKDIGAAAAAGVLTTPAQLAALVEAIAAEMESGL